MNPYISTIFEQNFVMATINVSIKYLNNKINSLTVKGKCIKHASSPIEHSSCPNFKKVM